MHMHGFLPSLQLMTCPSDLWLWKTSAMRLTSSLLPLASTLLPLLLLSAEDILLSKCSAGCTAVSISSSSMPRRHARPLKHHQTLLQGSYIATYLIFFFFVRATFMNCLTQCSCTLHSITWFSKKQCICVVFIFPSILMCPLFLRIVLVIYIVLLAFWLFYCIMLICMCLSAVFDSYKTPTKSLLSNIYRCSTAQLAFNFFSVFVLLLLV